MSDELRSLVEVISGMTLEARSEIQDAAERISAIANESQHAMIALALVGQAMSDEVEVPEI